MSVFEHLATAPSSCELQQKLDQLLLNGDEYSEYMGWRSLRVMCSMGTDARGELSRLNARAQLHGRVRDLMRQQGIRFETVFHLVVQRELREIDALLTQLQSVDVRLTDADMAPSPLSALWFRRPISAFLNQSAGAVEEARPRAASPYGLQRARSPVLRTNASAPQLAVLPLDGAVIPPRMSLSPTAAQLRSLRGSSSSTALSFCAFQASPSSSLVLQQTVQVQTCTQQRRSRESARTSRMSEASSTALSWSSVLHESSDDPFFACASAHSSAPAPPPAESQPAQQCDMMWSCVLQRSSDHPLEHSPPAAAERREPEIPELLPPTLLVEPLTTPRTRARMARVMEAFRASRGLIVRDLSDRADELSARVRRAELWLSMDAPQGAVKDSLQSFIACARMMVAFVAYLRQMFDGVDTNALPVHEMWSEAQNYAELKDGALSFMQRECPSAFDAATRAAQVAQRSMRDSDEFSTGSYERFDDGEY